MSQPAFDTRAFRQALGTFTTGVTIITTRDQDGAPVGITANSFNSVSMSPPLVLWSLAKSAYSLPAFENGEHWNVHVLTLEQEALSNRFASRGEDKFAGLRLDQGVSSAPLLSDCAARFQCRTVFVHDGGDHLIFVGEVLDFDRNDRPPLVFQAGQYALSTLKPSETPRLSEPPADAQSSYTEDLLGYLLGRAHFQLLHQLRIKEPESALDHRLFYVLSVLLIREAPSLDELNDFLAYTDRPLAAAELVEPCRLGYLEVDEAGETPRYRLTARGREIAQGRIAAAKRVEQEIIDQLGEADARALRLLLKRLIHNSDPGYPDLWHREAPLASPEARS